MNVVDIYQGVNNFVFSPSETIKAGKHHLILSVNGTVVAKTEEFQVLPTLQSHDVVVEKPTSGFVTTNFSIALGLSSESKVVARIIDARNRKVVGIVKAKSTSLKEFMMPNNNVDFGSYFVEVTRTRGWFTWWPKVIYRGNDFIVGFNFVDERLDVQPAMLNPPNALVLGDEAQDEADDEEIFDGSGNENTDVPQGQQKEDEEAFYGRQNENTGALQEQRNDAYHGFRNSIGRDSTNDHLTSVESMLIGEAFFDHKNEFGIHRRLPDFADSVK